MALRKLVEKTRRIEEHKFKGYGSYGSSAKSDPHKYEEFPEFSKRYQEERRKGLRE